MTIEVSVTNGVGTVTFNRPEVMNSVTAKILVQWEAAVQQLADRPDVRVIVLTGAGKAFCTGMDLNQPFDAGSDMPWSQDPNQASRLAKAVDYATGFVRTLRRISQPTIAAINGHTVGAGLSLAAACDIRLAAPQARFAAPFIQLGISGGDLGLSWFLPRIIGLPKATDMILNCRTIDATQALEIDLVTAVEQDVVAAAQAMGEHIGGFESYAVTTSKRLLEGALSSSLDAHLNTELTAQSLGAFTQTAQRQIKS